LEGALAAKRAADIVLAGTALLFTLPFFLLASLLVKLSSPGPVFFRQERCGLNGRRFDLLKFRTMVENADGLKDAIAHLNEMSGPVFKIKKDPRVTPVGRFLRKYSLDELPQLINVLKGDMSIVGPRPPIPAEVVKYEIWQRRRLSVRPGITCFWQVNGRNKVGFDDWISLDLKYIDNWSFKQDMKIILKTIPAVLRGTGV
ncbi:MAG: sugar transferase, partial [Deltaproteobacteria bacterium]|nr:sugar transferase [Deltaproteobacteria bacterium]